MSGLTDGDIPDGITASNYLPLSGGTLTGALSGTDLNLSGNLTAGTLSVAGLSSGGALFAPYFTATSTTATSTFAGGISASYASSTQGFFGTLTIGSLSLTTPLSAENGGTGISNPSAGGILIGSFAGGSWQQIATSSLGLLTTNVAEGSNLYFTNARADARINATTTIGTLTSAPNLGTVATSLTGFLKATAGVLSTSLIDLASDVTGILPVARGGTGWAALASGSIPYGNGSGAVATTSAGTAGQVLALLNGVPTWTATTTFSAPLSYVGGTVSIAQANSSTNGYVASGDWTLFNNKIASSSLSAAYPLAYNSATGNFSTAFSTTTGNSFNQLQQFNANASTSALTVTGNTYFPGSSVWRSDGNVGIGTSTPGTRLNVSGGGLSIEGDAAGSFSVNSNALHLSFNTTTNTGRLIALHNGVSWRALQIDGSSIALNAVTGGNVGIGTTTPSRLLTLSSAGSPELAIMSADAGSRLWTLQSTSGAGALPGTFQIIDRTAGLARLLIDTSGNVGVGIASPEYKLDIAAADLGTTAGSSSSMLRLYSNSGNGDFLRFYNYRTANGSSHTTSEQRIQRTIDVSDMGYIGLGSNYLAFAGNGTENMRINSSGNVGIGTTTPAQKLDVNGSVSLTNLLEFRPTSGAARAGYIWTQAGGGTDLEINNQQTAAIILSTANTEKMRVTAGGNVGIGTTSPIQKLHVYGGNAWVSTSDFALNSVGTVVSVGPGVATGNTYGLINATNVGGSAWGNLVLQSGGGNVGIGTTTPTTRLVVSKDSNAVSSEPFGDYQQNGQFFITGSTNAAKRLALGVDTAASTMFGVIQAIEPGVAVRSLSLNPSGGNVGIGTTSPGSILYLSASTPVLTLDNTATGGLNQVSFKEGSVIKGGINQIGSTFATANRQNNIEVINQTAAGAVSFWTNSGERVRIDSSGYVGIGTTTPHGLLHVAGGAFFGANHPGGGAYIQGNLGSAYTTSSAPDYSFAWNANTGMFHPAADTIAFSTGATERLRIDSSGNIGIGTASPIASLSVGSTTAQSGAVGKFAAIVAGFDQTTSNITDAGAHTGSLLLKDSGYAAGNGGVLLFGANSGHDRFFAGIKGLLTNGTGGTLGDLAFSTRNNTGDTALTERLRLTAAGNLGIGTTSPTHQLVVGNGTTNGVYAGTQILAAHTSDARLGAVAANAGAFLRYNATSGYGSLFAYDYGGVTVKNLALNEFGGNVGIGTTTPAVKLHVVGDSVGSISINSPSMDASAYTPSGVGAFAIRQGSALTDNSLIFGVNSSAGNSWIQSVDAGSQYLPLILNPSGGNVGIGTTTPSFPLDVAGSIRSQSSTQFTGFLGYNGSNYFGKLFGSSASNDNGALQLLNGGTTNVNIVASGVSYINGGNVGIGTTTPAEELVIASSGETRLMLDGGANQSPGLEFGSNGGETAILYRPANTSDLRYYNGADRVTFTSAGNVGIGTTSPTAQLSTTGTVRFSNFGAGTLTTDASGNLSVSSDERLKNIDGAFTRGLADVLKLSPIQYHWNPLSGLDTTTQYAGFSAQNVQSAIPEAVGSSNNGYLTLQDRPLIATVVNAIRELAQQVSNLAERVVTKELTFDRARGIEIDVEKLCIGSTCLTEQQIKAILAATGQDAGSPSTSALANTPQAPVLELNGNASSTIEVGTTYNDLGARIVAPESDLNLGLVIVLDDATTTAVSIDTTTPGEHTIIYTVTSPVTGLTGTIMRTVVVRSATDFGMNVPPQTESQPTAPAEDTNPFNAQPSNDNASSTPAVDTAA